MFYQNIDKRWNSPGTSPYCKKCMSRESTRRGRIFKKQAIEYLGGKCSSCGFSKSIAALDIHHIDPKFKKHNFGHVQTMTKEIKLELDHCVIFCANCHREFHEKKGSLYYRKRLKMKAVEYKGGECLTCGYSTSIVALTFHHRDPREKDFNIVKMTSMSEATFRELDKCDLLCENCHRQLHEER